MKKIWIFLSALILCLGLSGCGTRETDETKNNTNKNEVADETLNEEINKEDEMDEANLERADQAEKNVTDLDEVESATVIVTNNNAYVAAVLTSKGNVAEGSEELDQINAKISDQVKEIKPDIDNVYVSVNPDFTERMSDYADKINEGEPVEGLGEEFNILIKRIFPDAH